MTDSSELVCKPTKWFLWRALAMILMFAVGAFFFFKDWKYGYPEKNVKIFYFLAFEEAKADFAKHLLDGKGPEDWENYAKEQKVFRLADKDVARFGEVAAILPEGTDLGTPWPEIVTSYESYAPLYEQGKNIASPPGWKEFTNSGGREWDEKSSRELMSEKKIKEQLYIGILCLVLLAAGLYFLFRTLGRTMRVDGEGYTPPGGRKILFTDIKRMDIRKWDTKGLALVYYSENGAEKKTKVDGMVYGQFKKEEGEPAQKLYERIMENFRGEVIELAPEEDEDEAPDVLSSKTETERKKGNDSDE